MILYRGLTQGRIDVPKIIASIQAEWIIRLFGSLILWQMGFGLGGIALAMALSILAGYICSTDHLSLGAKTPKTAPHQRHKWQDMHGLIITALPYLILQFAQILVLDSDIFIAKTLLSSESAGMVARAKNNYNKHARSQTPLSTGDKVLIQDTDTHRWCYSGYIRSVRPDNISFKIQLPTGKSSSEEEDF